MTVALVVATAVARDRARRRAPGAEPDDPGQPGSGAPTHAAAPVAARLPLPGLRRGEVTAQPLLTRLCAQLGQLGVSEVVVVAPPAQADVLAAMAWDGLSPPGSLPGGGFASAVNIDVIACGSVGEELRAAAAVARRAAASGDAILVCPGDVVAHTEALVRVCRETETSALTAALAGRAAAPDPDLRPALRVVAGEQAGRRRRGQWNGTEKRRDDAVAAGRNRGGPAGSGRCAVVAAGSTFHRVNAPNAAGCGVFIVSAPDMPELAATAEELAVIADQDECRDGTSAPASGRAGQRAGAAPAVPRQAAWRQHGHRPAPRHRSGFADSPALLLVGLVRRGVGVRATGVGPLVCVRAQTQHDARSAAAELNAVNEDRVRLNAAVRHGRGLVATCCVNPYAKYLARAAHRRKLTANALSGMSIGLGLLAALWYAAGSTAGLILGGVFLFASFVLACMDGQLARYARGETPFGAWLGAVGGRLTEFAVYAGLAVGAAGPAGASGLIGSVATAATGSTVPPSRGVWQLAVAAMILQSLRDMAGFCADAAAPRPVSPDRTLRLPLDEPADFAIPAPAGAGPGRNGARPSSVRLRPGRAAAVGRRPRQLTRAGLSWLAEIVRLRPGERVAVVVVTAIVAGARATFLLLLAWGLAAACLVICQQMRSRPAVTGHAGAPPVLVTYRDDGIASRWLGRFVNGQLPPLAPALAGAIVTTILCVAGVTTLSGMLVFTPVAVMALAATGSAHPHDRRLDWLVPPLLQLAEYVFLVSLGRAAHVPPPLLFALPGVIALHHYDVVYRLRRDTATGLPAASARAGPAVPPRWLFDAGLGWEGRMLAAALGAVFGIELLAFAGLTVYLGVLFGWESMTGWLTVTHPPHGSPRRAFRGATGPPARAGGLQDGGGR